LTQDALLLEYEKLIDLLQSEGRISWELVSIYIVIQTGLASAVAVLLAVAPFNMGNLRFLFLSLAGLFSSFGWCLIRYRANMRRENWFLAGLRHERQLVDSGILIRSDFNIFEIERIVKERKNALELFNNEIRFRRLHWYEKIGALRLTHWAMFLIGIGWLTLIIISLVQRLC
jgi:hypothetical protein